MFENITFMKVKSLKFDTFLLIKKNPKKVKNDKFMWYANDIYLYFLGSRSLKSHLIKKYIYVLIIFARLIILKPKIKNNIYKKISLARLTFYF